MLSQIAVIACIALAWQAYAEWLANPLILPTLGQTLSAWCAAVGTGELPSRSLASLTLLAKGYFLGVIAAAALSGIALFTHTGETLSSTLTAIFSPLPGIALLPLALIWFGLGAGSVIFVLAHSVLWPLSLTLRAGFSTFPETLRLVGRNYGFGPGRLMLLVLIPASLPALLSGLRIAWAFAWRTLIAAELIFGVNVSSGGLGWFIFENRNQLEIAKVFAGLLTVVMIGLIVEILVFGTIERLTIQRWGMGPRLNRP